MRLLQVIDASLFSWRINKAYDLMVKKDFAGAMSILEKIRTPEGRFWFYELMMGECSFELGKTEEAGRYFDNLSKLILGDEFNLSEKCHVAIYLIKKYNYNNLRLDRSCGVVSEEYDAGKVRDRLRRYMPLG
ncbi:hypothetical protein NKH14_28715 [Mesorhizobium sp. M1380]|uniref:hypothetical protein n=1 Tax=Mesorhizobium sp. M1380 TaxID=2957093 RepID=UPI003337692E